MTPNLFLAWSWFGHGQLTGPDTKNGDKSKGIPSHEELDNPGNAKSKEFYAMANNATGAFILCVLSNLDQDQDVFVKQCGEKLNIYLNAQL